MIILVFIVGFGLAADPSGIDYSCKYDSFVNARETQSVLDRLQI